MSIEIRNQNALLLSYEECRKAVRGKALSSLPDGFPLGVSIDSRTILPGQLFLAVSGDRFDGHDFLEQALQAGAAGTIVSRKVAVPPGKVIVQVDDTRRALGQLASACRQKWSGRVVCITGSAGKTTTKEMTAEILSQCSLVHRSQGNFNNEIGLSLTLLGLRADHQRLVVELGMNHRGEIARLAAMASPDTGVLTCVAPVHLGFFSSLEEIADAKVELIPEIREGGCLVYNADDPLLAIRADPFPGKKITFGLSAGADVRAVEIVDRGMDGSTFRLLYGQHSRFLQTRLPGIHNILNRLAAVAAATAEGIPFAVAAAIRSEEYSVGHRGERIRFHEGFTVLDDTYNSNPCALEGMMEVLSRTAGVQRRLLVIGEMLELGPASAELHRNCGRRAASLGFQQMIGVQGDARFFLEGARENGMPPSAMVYAENAEEAVELLAARLCPGDLVLIKGSRGVRLDRMIDSLTGRYTVRTDEPEETGSGTSC